MKLRQRYRKLSLWSKIGLWGSLASIVGILVPVILPGLANLSLGNHELTQEGIIPITGDNSYDVYYRTGYRGQPVLLFIQESGSPGREHFELIQNRPDGFRIEMFHRSNLETNGIHWKATGIKAH